MQHIQYHYLIRLLSSEIHSALSFKKRPSFYNHAASSWFHDRAACTTLPTIVLEWYYQRLIFDIAPAYVINTANTVIWIDLFVFKDTLGLKWNLLSFFVTPNASVLVGGLSVFSSTGWKQTVDQHKSGALGCISANSSCRMHFILTHCGPLFFPLYLS
jgi:hypothetical protein